MKLLLYSILISIYLQGIQANVLLKDNCCSGLSQEVNVEKSCPSKCCKTKADSCSEDHKEDKEKHKGCDSKGMCKCTLCHHFVTYIHWYLNPPQYLNKIQFTNEVKPYTALLEKDFHLTIFQPPKFTVIA